MTATAVKPPTLEEQFEEFVAANPQVVNRLAELALNLIDNGVERLSINMLFETVRYEALVSVDPHSNFRLNNSYRSRMARLLMERHPELNGRFQVRELRT